MQSFANSQPDDPPVVPRRYELGFVLKSVLNQARSRQTLAFVAPLVLGGCNGGVLTPQGPVGEAERTILFDSMAIMLAIIVPTIIATLIFAWWFRSSNERASYQPDFVYSGRIELVVWGIPALVILFLGGIIWIGSHQLDPADARSVPGASEKDALPIQAVSLDWKWLFIYPDQNVAAVNQLVVPVGRPIHFTLTSASVMNVFFVPELGSMIYTMNGMTTELYLQADHPGEYYGRSAHFSGDGFPGMEFKLTAASQDVFDSWTKAAQAGGPALDRAAYRALAKQSADVPRSTFRSVEPGLFDAIASQSIPPASGPQVDATSAASSSPPGG